MCSYDNYQIYFLKVMLIKYGKIFKHSTSYLEINITGICFYFEEFSFCKGKWTLTGWFAKLSFFQRNTFHTDRQPDRLLCDPLYLYAS